MIRTRRMALLACAALLLPSLGSEAEAQNRRRQARRDRPDEPPPRVRRRRRLLRRGRVLAWRERLIARRLANRARFDVGRNGEQVLRSEILAINPSEPALAQAIAQGFTQLRASGGDALGVRIVVLRSPEGMGTLAALDMLSQADPHGVYELNHVFDPSQGESSGDAIASQPPAHDGAGLKIGMIDAGLDRTHPALASARIEARGFVGAAAPSPHGTAVASLLVGEDDDFSGCAPGAALFAADVFGDSAEGGSAEAIANALAWMAEQGVGVVNISLVGPPNRALDAVCRAMVARGLIIVAAVGNEGPTSPVGFPAACPGVVAVTAVDADNRIYLSANRGPQVAFAALGVNVEAAVDEGAYEELSGTSFAAPIVAALLARRAPANATQAVAQLSRAALDLGAPGRDVVYGYGLVR
ncbi:MAG: S8 family serine peptidase [Hyphomonadaceae bacterium]|nr:S8 family serine peptidase [Hyphomonadaceae bacterium]